MRCHGEQRACTSQRPIWLHVVIALALTLIFAAKPTLSLALPPTSPSAPWSDDQSNQTVALLTTHNDPQASSTKESVDALRSRLDNYFGTDKYRMLVEGDRIQLSFPQNAFGNLETEQVLNSYFARPTELYAYSSKKAPDYYTIERNSTHIKRANILSASVSKDGTVTIQLDEPTYKKVRTLDEAPGALELILDVNLHPPYALTDLELEDTTNAVRILPDPTHEPTVEQKLSDALVFALSHEAMPDSFDAIVEPRIDWHSFDSSDAVAINRVDASTIEQDSAVISLERDELNDGINFQWKDKDALGILCTRLDSMGVPYALGSPIDTISYIAVLLPIECGGEPVAALLGNTKPVASDLDTSVVQPDETEDANHPYDEVVNAQVVIGLNDFEVKYAKAKTDSPNTAFVCQVKDEQCEQYRQALAQAKGAPVYLAVDRRPLFVCNANELVGQNELTFTKTCFDSLGDHTWLFSLADTVLNGPHMPPGTDIKFSVQPRDGYEAKQSLVLGTTYQKQLDELLKKTRKIVPKASARIDDRSVSVDLHLDVDESLPEQGLSKVEEIYKSLDFENTMFDGIGFSLCETQVGERASIHFSKYSGDSVIEDGPHIYLFGMFRGGRFERYGADFKSRFLRSEFYQPFTNSPFSFFRFE